MIVEHRTSKKQYTLTTEAWGKIVASGKKDAYKIIDAPEKPKEIKTVRPAKATTKAESDNTHGNTDTIDQLPDGDIGNVE